MTSKYKQMEGIESREGLPRCHGIAPTIREHLPVAIDQKQEHRRHSNAAEVKPDVVQGLGKSRIHVVGDLILEV
jgi:hypothetical protein